MKSGNPPSNFCKLKNNFVIEDYTVFDVQLSYGVNLNGQFKGIEYLNCSIIPKVYEVIPEKYRNEFNLLLMRVNTEIPPHTDSGIKTTINFYIKTDDCLTQFYTFKSNNPKTYQVENQTDGHIYSEEDLEKIDSFVAQPNEAWVLDVTKPHSVIPQSNMNERLAVALGTNLSYNEVCNILYETGNL